MKKSLIIAIVGFVIIAFVAYGQVSNTKPHSQSDINKYIFCELWESFQGNLFGSNTTLSLNFGTISTYQRQSEESSYVKGQKDVVDALNYLSDNGWELVTKNLRTLESGVEVSYLLRKKSR